MKLLYKYNIGRVWTIALLAALAVACNAASFRLAGGSSTGAVDATATNTAGDGDAVGDPSSESTGTPPAGAATGAPSVTIKANNSEADISVTASSNVTVAWTSVGATDCAVSPLNVSGTSGSQVVKVDATTTYSVQCNTASGSITDTVTVFTTTAVAPSVLVKANGQTGSITAKPNDTVTITWESQNANQCTISPSGSTGTSGSLPVTVGTKAVVYVASCSGPGGTIQDTVVINVGNSSTLKADLKVNGTDVAVYIPHLTKVNLAWTSSGATRCELSPYGDKRLQASLTTESLSAPVIFALFCEDAVASVIDAIAVNVAPPTTAVPDLKINGSDGPVIASAGQTLTISWTSTGATSCALTPEVGSSSSLSASGELTTTATNSLVTYVLTCDGPGGQGSDSVVVMPQVTQPTATITANGSSGLVSVNLGSTVTLSWSSTAASSCTISPGGYTGVAGTATAGPINARTDFVLLCQGPFGEATATVTVVPKNQYLSATLLVNGSSQQISVQQNSKLNIAWTSSAAVSCNVSPFGYTGVNGVKTTGAVASNLVVTLVCTDGAGGSQTVSVPVKVITYNASYFVDLKVNGHDNVLYLEDKKTVQLVWSSSGTTSCALGTGLAVATNGSVMANIVGDTKVTITCQTLTGGTVTDYVQVYVRNGGILTSQVGINFEDQYPGSRDGDFNDFTLCGCGGLFTIYGSEVISNKAQTVSFTTSKRSGCDHKVKIEITHPDGSKESPITFNSSARPSALALSFRAGSKLNVWLTPLGECKPNEIHSMQDPLWAIVKANECRRTGY